VAAGISHLDVVAPDIYLPDLRGVLASYDHLGNPLLIPETRNGAAGGANALYAFARASSASRPSPSIRRPSRRIALWAQRIECSIN